MKRHRDRCASFCLFILAASFLIAPGCAGVYDRSFVYGMTLDSDDKLAFVLAREKRKEVDTWANPHNMKTVITDITLAKRQYGEGGREVIISKLDDTLSGRGYAIHPLSEGAVLLLEAGADGKKRILKDDGSNRLTSWLVLESDAHIFESSDMKHGLIAKDDGSAEIFDFSARKYKPIISFKFNLKNKTIAWFRYSENNGNLYLCTSELISKQRLYFLRIKDGKKLGNNINGEEIFNNNAGDDLINIVQLRGEDCVLSAVDGQLLALRISDRSVIKKWKIKKEIGDKIYIANGKDGEARYISVIDPYMYERDSRETTTAEGVRLICLTDP